MLARKYANVSTHALQDEKLISSACAMGWEAKPLLRNGKLRLYAEYPGLTYPAALNVNDARKALRGKDLSGHRAFEGIAAPIVNGGKF